MKCPFCNTAFAAAFVETTFATLEQVYSRTNKFLAPQIAWSASYQRCPECHETIIFLSSQPHGRGPHRNQQGPPAFAERKTFMAHPHSRSRPIPPEVPDPYRKDFSEACAVLADSANASAALSRRCLQAILANELGAKKRDLYDQIEEVIASGKLPSYIEDGLHDVRNIGKFGAHPIKSTSSGTIVDVEPGEAESNLDVLESLFDFCFVARAAAAKRKAALDQKLKDAAKPQRP